VQLVVTAPAGVVVHPDGQRVAQVVANLVQNALKFARTPVSVEVRSEGGVGVVAVDDDGPGIPDADRAPVFERLYVAGHQPPPKESGSGLGLAIVRELVDAMGGEVAAEVSPLGGARLLAPLPLSVSATVPPAGGAAR